MPLVKQILDNAIAKTGKTAFDAVVNATKDFDVDTAYAGITHAETGSFKDPYIRTVAKNTPGGSTAFGPAQITYSTALGALNAGYLSPSSVKFFTDVLQPRYELMKKYGNEPKKPGYDSAYDYGGNAYFDPGQHGQDYEMFAKEVMQGIGNKEANGRMKAFTEKWRGKNMFQDPGYFDRVNLGVKAFKKRMNV